MHRIPYQAVMLGNRAAVQLDSTGRESADTHKLRQSGELEVRGVPQRVDAQPVCAARQPVCFRRRPPCRVRTHTGCIQEMLLHAHIKVLNRRDRRSGTSPRPRLRGSLWDVGPLLNRLDRGRGVDADSRQPGPGSESVQRATPSQAVSVLTPTLGSKP
jgi:hypothetical protein